MNAKSPDPMGKDIPSKTFENWPEDEDGPAEPPGSRPPKIPENSWAWIYNWQELKKKLAWKIPKKATKSGKNVELPSFAISNSSLRSVTASKERWRRFAKVVQNLCRWPISSTRTGPMCPHCHRTSLTQRSGEISPLLAPISRNLHVKVAPVALAGEIASSSNLWLVIHTLYSHALRWGDAMLFCCTDIIILDSNLFKYK